MRGKPMVLIKDQNGCIVSTSHRLNKDGYLRIRDKSLVSRFPLPVSGFENGSVETRYIP